MYRSGPHYRIVNQTTTSLTRDGKTAVSEVFAVEKYELFVGWTSDREIIGYYDGTSVCSVVRKTEEEARAYIAYETTPKKERVKHINKVTSQFFRNGEEVKEVQE